MLDMILRWLPLISTRDLDAIETAIERERVRRDVCEHGVPAGEHCPDCRAEYRRAQQEAGIDD